jgi:hypothetical protein
VRPFLGIHPPMSESKLLAPDRTRHRSHQSLDMLAAPWVITRAISYVFGRYRLSVLRSPTLVSPRLMDLKATDGHRQFRSRLDLDQPAMGSSVPEKPQSSPVQRVFYGRVLAYWMLVSVERFPSHTFIGSCRPLKPEPKTAPFRCSTFRPTTTTSDRELTSCETNTLCVAAARRTLLLTLRT